MKVSVFFSWGQGGRLLVGFFFVPLEGGKILEVKKLLCEQES